MTDQHAVDVLPQPRHELDHLLELLGARRVRRAGAGRQLRQGPARLLDVLGSPPDHCARLVLSLELLESALILRCPVSRRVVVHPRVCIVRRKVHHSATLEVLGQEARESQVREWVQQGLLVAKPEEGAKALQRASKVEELLLYVNPAAMLRITGLQVLEDFLNSLSNVSSVRRANLVCGADSGDAHRVSVRLHDIPVAPNSLGTPEVIVVREQQPSACRFSAQQLVVQPSEIIELRGSPCLLKAPYDCAWQYSFQPLEQLAYGRYQWLRCRPDREETCQMLGLLLDGAEALIEPREALSVTDVTGQRAHQSRLRSNRKCRGQRQPCVLHCNLFAVGCGG
mmetsp:Transcript_4499/g.17080  ORF Transcript_4499/g.17080 Transcript_4499/m.17080 type:complete len:340 (+) Transcript_4499:146-1165(+)